MQQMLCSSSGCTELHLAASKDRQLMAGWGLGVCILAMLAAGVLEQWRLQLFAEGRVMPEGHHHQGVVDLSVFWQTGQYLLIGLSEVRSNSLLVPKD